MLVATSTCTPSFWRYGRAQRLGRRERKAFHGHARPDGPALRGPARWARERARPWPGLAMAWRAGAAHEPDQAVRWVDGWIHRSLRAARGVRRLFRCAARPLPASHVSAPCSRRQGRRGRAAGCWWVVTVARRRTGPLTAMACPPPQHVLPSHLLANKM